MESSAFAMFDMLTRGGKIRMDQGLTTSSMARLIF